MAKRLTREEAINKFNEVHGEGKYGYEDFEYVNAFTKGKIKCNKCGNVFYQTPHIHARGSGCPYCGVKSSSIKRNLGNEGFIKKAIQKHGDIHMYDKVDYKKNKKKVLIGCKKCGRYFLQTPSDHLSGCGCPYCNGGKKHTQEEFVKLSIKRWGVERFDLSRAIYNGNRNKIELGCKVCGNWFLQNAGDHLSGAGCPYCAQKKKGASQRLTNEEFVKRGNVVHGCGSFDYSSVEYYNSNTKVQIKCNRCGKVFWQTPTDHLSGYGCPHCSFSKKEKIIERWLIEHNIKFEAQKRFNDCRDKNTLPFDFYLSDFNVCIEFQGDQHFHPRFFVNFLGEKVGMERFKKLQYHDKIKKEYCKNNGIKLVEITTKQKLPMVLDELIKELEGKKADQ